MKQIKSKNAAYIYRAAKAYATNKYRVAKFVTLCFWDGKIMFNDPGEFAIPSRTKLSVQIQFRKNKKWNLKTIERFLMAVNLSAQNLHIAQMILSGEALDCRFS